MTRKRLSKYLVASGYDICMKDKRLYAKRPCDKKYKDITEWCRWSRKDLKTWVFLKGILENETTLLPIFEKRFRESERPVTGRMVADIIRKCTDTFYYEIDASEYTEEEYETLLKLTEGSCFFEGAIKRDG